MVIGVDFKPDKETTRYKLIMNHEWYGVAVNALNLLSFISDFASGTWLLLTLS